MIKIVAISDTHGKWSGLTIPECDILISAGDYSWRGEHAMVWEFHTWLNKQPAKHVISVQGNHELFVEKDFQLSKETAQRVCPNVHFIDEGLVEVEGLRIWCSAITPFFCDWAWNRFPGEEIQRHWDNIPKNIDVLVTHGQCYGILDIVESFSGVDHVGCPQLLKKVLEVKPKLYIGGHLHAGYGTHTTKDTTFINAAICDEQYNPTNKPIIIAI